MRAVNNIGVATIARHPCPSNSHGSFQGVSLLLHALMKSVFPTVICSSRTLSRLCGQKGKKDAPVKGVVR